MRCWWLVPFVLVLTPGVARSEDVQPTSYARGLSGAMKKAHVVEVPLVEQEGGQVVLANRSELLRAGVVQVGRGGRPGGDLDEVLHALSLRPATPAEVRAGKVKYVALATRYSAGPDSGKKGDGRAALIGDLVITDARGRLVGSLEVQSKGVGTGLAPEGANARHGTGKALLMDSIVEAVMSDYLQANGNAAHGWLSVVAYDEVVEVDDGAIRDRAAVLTRIGTFLRIGHLEQVRDSPELLRAMLDDINGRLSRAMGRKRPMDLPQLFRELTRLKAHDLSDLYWSRVAHGSLTGDNIGLFETIDLATANIVRGSDSHAYEWKYSPGFAYEPQAVLSRRYAGWLLRYMRLAASPGELARLDREIPDPERMARSMLLERDAFNALFHAGFDRDDISFLLKAHGDQVKAFARQVVAYAQADRPTSNDRRIGLFNIFGTVSHLAHVTSEVRRGRPEALLRFGITRAAGDPAAQVPRARALLASYAPLLRAVQRGRTRAEKRAKLALIKEQARIVNRAVEPMGQAFHRAEAWREMTDGLTGSPRERARAQAALRAFVRRNVRRGPDSIPATVAAIRHDQLPRLGGRLVLSATSEENVTIRELSDGVSDSLLVTLSGNPMRVRDQGAIALVLSGPERPLRFEPTRVSGDEVVYQIPLDPALRAALPQLSLAFRAGSRGRKRWDNGGFGFGRDLQWRLASPLIHTELAAVAAARGQRRAGVTPSAVRAVAAPPYRQRGAPLAFGNLRRSSWQNHADRYRVVRSGPTRRPSARPAARRAVRARGR